MQYRSVRPAAAILLASLALVLLSACALAQKVYVATSQNQFGALDLTSGIFDKIADTNLILAMTFAPNGILYAADFNNIETINPLTGSVTSSVTIGSRSFDGLAFSPDGSTLYAVDGQNTLYSLDLIGQHATTIGTASAGLQAETGSLMFGSDGLLYNIMYHQTGAPANPDNLYVRNPATGAETIVAPNQDSGFYRGLTRVNNKFIVLNSADRPDYQIYDIASGTPVSSGVTWVDSNFEEIPYAMAYYDGAAATPEPGSIALALAGAVWAVALTRGRRR